MALYHPPLAGREGLRLDFNENTLGCSPRVLDRLSQITAEHLARYPEREPIEAQVADWLRVSAEEVLLTNGVDESIHLLCQTYLEPGDEVLIVEPSYSMYRIYAMASGGRVVGVPAGVNFEFPLDELLKQTRSRTRLIMIANPNNPTGAVASQQALVQIARSAPDAAILIDEAYFEFYGQTMLEARDNFPNMFVARTFSKAYGLAGLRIGMLLGDADQMRAIRRVSSPYNVNAVALACLSEALTDQSYLLQYVQEVLEARTRLEKLLRLTGVPFWPSNANFVLLRVGTTKATAARFVEQMRLHGILVRDRSNDLGCEGCVRITLGPAIHTERLLSSVQEVLESMGIAQGVQRS